MLRLNWQVEEIPAHILKAYGGRGIRCRKCGRRMKKELKVFDLGPWTVPMIIEDLRKLDEPVLTHHLQLLCQFCHPLH